MHTRRTVERPMNTSGLIATLSTLLSELVDGTPPTGGYMLNLDDPGLLKSLDRLSAAEASAIVSAVRSDASASPRVAANAAMPGSPPMKARRVSMSYGPGIHS